MKLQAGCRPATVLIRENTTQVFSSELFEFFKNRLFKEQLRSVVTFENVELNFFKLKEQIQENHVFRLE